MYSSHQLQVTLREWLRHMDSYWSTAESIEEPLDESLEKPTMDVQSSPVPSVLRGHAASQAICRSLSVEQRAGLSDLTTLCFELGLGSSDGVEKRREGDVETVAGGYGCDERVGLSFETIILAKWIE